MIQFINYIISFYVDWFDCIRNPLITYRRVLNSPISDNEKILFSIRIWIFSILLSFSIEVPLYYYFGIKFEWSFLFSHFAYGLFYIFIPSFFMHISLRIFKIKSIFYESFIIYAIIVGAYSPFILLLSWPKTFNHFLLIKAIKDEGISKIFGLNNISQINFYFFKETNYEPFVAVIASFMNIFYLVIHLAITVLLSYAIIEKYNSNKYKTLLSITFSQMIMLHNLFIFIIRDIILYIYSN